MLLGGEQFVQQLRPLLQDKAAAEAISKAGRLAGRPPPEALFEGIGGDKQERNRKIYEAVREHGYTLNEVGEVVGLHYSTISRIVKRVEQREGRSGHSH